MADVTTAVLIGRIGDLLVAGPFLRALKRGRPGARLRLVGAAQCAQAADLMPWLDDRLYLHKVTRMRENVMLAYSLVRGGQDLVVDLNPAPSRSSAAIVAALRADRKLGFAKERFAGVFTETAAAPKEDEHMLDRYARLAAVLGLPFDPKLEAVPTAAQDREGEALAGRFGGTKRRVLIVAGNFKKFDNRWPEDKFSELCRTLAREDGIEPLFLAGPGEQEPVRKIAEGAGLAGREVSPSSLGATGALMKRADLVVCNITGTTHLAAAVGAPTLGIFSGYTHAVWRPRGEKHSAVVSKDWRSCRAIPVSDVLSAVRGRLTA